MSTVRCIEFGFVKKKIELLEKVGGVDAPSSPW